MLSSQDHKPAYSGDRGPNTGGMGAYSPAPVVGSAVHDRIMREVMIPTVRALASEGRPYRGVLYAGLMIKEGEPKVLEFNARFGDPEAQPILMQMDSDLVPILNATVDGTLESVRVEWRTGASVCVVMASQGYPGTYAKGHVIRGLDAVRGMEGVVVFHAGTARRDSELVTSGGRVLGVTARGSTIAEAISRAYGAVEQIHWDGVYYRTDIGHKALDKANAG
jgi:phosphoribosylamine--glycine ligase